MIAFLTCIQEFPVGVKAGVQTILYEDFALFLKSFLAVPHSTPRSFYFNIHLHPNIRRCTPKVRVTEFVVKYTTEH
jgi:hypothetical protein